MVTKTTKAPTKSKVTETAVARKGGSTEALKKLQKKYSETMSLNAWRDSPIVDVIPTGSLLLDIATGIGGFPRGRITELAGKEAAGKTTTALKSIARAQRMGYRCALIDAEFAFDPEWAQHHGVNLETLEVFTPNMLEVGGEIAVALADSGEYDFIVFDSIAGAGIEQQQEGELSDANMGARARVMGNLMSKLPGPVYRNKVWLIAINQLRENFNKYVDEGYVTPGGAALKYASSLRIWLFGNKKKADSFSIITAKIKKNKLATPFKEAMYQVDAEEGTVDTVNEVISVFTDPAFHLKLGIVREGSYYNIPADLTFEGKPERLYGAPALERFVGGDMEYLPVLVDKLRAKLIKHEDIGSREHTGAVGIAEESEEE